MKKIFVLMLLVVFTALAVNDNVISGDIGGVSPSDISIINLHDNTLSSSDTLGKDSSNVYGPYKLARSSGEQMYKGFQMYFSNCLDANDSLYVDYQFVYGSNITDTCPVWTRLDTVGPNGDASPYVDLSSIAAKGVVFRLTNSGATTTSTAIIDDFYKVLFKID